MQHVQSIHPEPEPTLMDAGVRQAIDAVMHLLGSPADVIAAAISAELATQGRILTTEFVHRVATVFAGDQVPAQRSALPKRAVDGIAG